MNYNKVKDKPALSREAHIAIFFSEFTQVG